MQLDSRMRTGLLRLPVELLAEIVQFSSLEDRLTLCRVSADFYSLAVPTIYRFLRLESSRASVLKCTRTLARKEIAAKAVRRLEVVECDWACTPKKLSLKKAFDKMQNLRQLILSVDALPYRQGLESAIFPQLELFECSFRLGSVVLSFLGRHPTLTKLVLHSPLAKDMKEHSEPITLPNLQDFCGELQHLRWVGRGAPLTQVSLEWHKNIYNTELFEEAIDILVESAQNLKQLRFIRPSDNVAHLDTISQKLPNIDMLQISDIPLYTRTDKVRVRLVRTYLARMENLFAIQVEGRYERGPGTRKFSYDEDHEAVLAIAEHCPNLVAFHTPRNITWFCHKEGLWEPALGDYHGARWAMNKKLNEENPGWKEELLHANLADFETFLTIWLADRMGLLGFSDEEDDSDDMEGDESDWDSLGPSEDSDESGNDNGAEEGPV